MISSAQLFVKSHVARDLLQNAGLFKTDKLVIWEYVANGLQYISPANNPEVRVTLDNKKKRVSIKENGRGKTGKDGSKPPGTGMRQTRAGVRACHGG